MTDPTPEQPVDIINLADVDRVIHEPARLIIMAYLSMVESADFLFLMQQTGLTFGNLSSHMKKLEEAKYIEVHKEFVDRRPHTMLKLTKSGRASFKEYKKQMRHLFEED
jgi:DNA-binding MarR family transcriptional regulator